MRLCLVIIMTRSMRELSRLSERGMLECCREAFVGLFVVLERWHVDAPVSPSVKRYLVPPKHKDTTTHGIHSTSNPYLRASSHFRSLDDSSEVMATSAPVSVAALSVSGTAASRFPSALGGSSLIGFGCRRHENNAINKFAAAM